MARDDLFAGIGPVPLKNVNIIIGGRRTS